LETDSWPLPHRKQTGETGIEPGLIEKFLKIQPTGTRQTEAQRQSSDKTGITSAFDVTTLPEGEKDSGNHQAGIQVTGSGKLEKSIFEGTSIIKPAFITEVAFSKIAINCRGSTVLLCLHIRHLNHAGRLVKDRIRSKPALSSEPTAKRSQKRVI
jgi:hypothetical protein